MPPLTPSRMRDIATGCRPTAPAPQALAPRLRPCPSLAVVVLDLPRCYLLEGDREVVFRGRLDHRGRELIEGSLAEVVVVAVDLAGALGGHDHAGVVGVNSLQQAVYSGGDHVCVAFPG